MNTERWLRRFMDLAEHISTWSKDPSTKIGAIIVNRDKVIVGAGYNGFPRKVADYDHRYASREEKYRMIIHAEMNAILNASASVKNCSLFTWPLMPCSRCATMVIQAGITEIYYPNFPLDHPMNEAKSRWAEDSIYSVQMFKEAGVRTVLVDSSGVKL